ncbi:hypothetical protein ACTA71_003917 [Dictyostelium dimigraforme]
MKFLVVFFILNILFIKSFGVNFFQLIPDFYAENGYCYPKFALIGSFSSPPSVIIITGLSADYFRTSLKQTIGTSSHYEINTNCTVGQYNIVSLNDGVNTYPLDTTITYDCLEPPIQPNFDIYQDLITTTPPSSTISFILKIYNVSKQLSLKATNSPYPYIYSFSNGFLTNNSTYMARFIIQFSPSNRPQLIPEKLLFNISYGSTSNIELYLFRPLIDYDDNVCYQRNNYRIGNSYTSSHIWDTSLITSCNTVNKSISELFLYSKTIDGINLFNQWFKMVGGNETSAQFLLSSSFLDLNRPKIGFQVSSLVYDNDSTIETSSINFDVIPYIIQPIQVTTNNSLIKMGFNIENSRSILFSTGMGSASNILLSNLVQFKYPYGVGLGTMSNFTYQTSVLITQIMYSLFFVVNTNIAQDLNPSNLYYNSSQINTDIPFIKSMEIYYPRGGDGKRAILQVRIISNGAGLSWMKYCGNIITARDLVNGTIYDGYFEKIIIVTFEKPPILIMRTDGEFKFYYTYYSLDPLKEIPYINAFNNSINGVQSLSVKRFQFEAQNVNVDYGFLQTLYFDYNGSTLDIPISFYLLDPIYGESSIDPMDVDVGQYLKDKDEDAFKIQFVIPSRKCTGNIPYIIKVDGITYTMDYFYSLFGNAANLNVISTDCDEMPPIIKNITYIPNIQPTNGNEYTCTGIELTVGWTVTIEDRINGLKSAYFRVIGDKDPVPLEFNFTPRDSVSGDQYLGQYNIIFNVRPTILGQSYTFENIILIDNSGHKSQLIDDNYNYNAPHETSKSLLSPIYNIDSTTMNFLTFIVNTPDFTPETEAPTLSIFNPSTLNMNTFSETRDISFEIQTKDNTALLHDSHKPTVFLEYYINDLVDSKLTSVECKTELLGTELVSSSVVLANYTAMCSLPYGFGGGNGFIASIFGIVDTSFNFNGYTSLDLSVIPGFNSIILPISQNKSPYIEGFTSVSTSGGLITLSGNNFGGQPKIFITDNSSLSVQNNIVYSSNVVLITKVVPFNSEKLFVNVQDQTTLSQSNFVEITVLPDSSSSSSSFSSSSSSSSGHTVTPTSTSSPSQSPTSTSTPTSTPNPTSTSTPTSTPTTEPNIVCLNNCGGSNRGKCIENVGCHCFSPFGGFDCSSEIIKVPQPKTNMTSPDVTNEIPIDGSSIKLNIIISIVAIREINFDNTYENIHYFDIWSFKNQSTTKFSYSSQIKKGGISVSNITVIAEWFEKETEISFAGENFTINPSSLKYTVSIDHYPFSTSLNTLELIFKSFIETSKTNDICSSDQFGLNDNSNYLELQVGEYSFLSKYLKRANIDNIVRTISNRVLTDFNENEKLNSTTSSKKLSFVGIQIPFYKVNIELDPDFSVLLNSNAATSNSDNSICSSSSSSLSKAQIAGIVIGSVVFFIVFILIILILLPSNSKLSLRIFLFKIKRRVGRKL